MSELDDEQKIGRRETKARILRRRDLEDVAFVLSSVEGRRFYWRLMGEFGLMRNPFTGNNSTFFNCGEMNAALKMWKEMEEADPTAYLKMHHESKLEEAKNNG